MMIQRMEIGTYHLTALDRTPSLLSVGFEVSPKVHDVIQDYNSLLTSSVPAFQAAHPGSSLAIVDEQPVFNDILDNPQAYGAPNATCFNDDGYSCLWWNNFHPGLAIQGALGDAVYEALSNGNGGDENSEFYSGTGGMSSKGLMFAGLQNVYGSITS